MPTSVEELAAQPGSPSADERERLAELLLASLPDDSGGQVSQAWDEEIQRRLQELESGTAKLYTSEDVHAEARKIRFNRQPGCWRSRKSAA
jgi:putative addiction module component (TIGR02574 family)